MAGELLVARPFHPYVVRTRVADRTGLGLLLNVVIAVFDNGIARDARSGIRTKSSIPDSASKP